MTEAIRFVINILIPLALLLAWLMAEFRCRVCVRVVLGLACLFFPLLWIWATIYSTGMLLDMHRTGLQRIERRLEEGRVRQVQEAIRVYRDTFHDTQSAKAAAYRMNSFLETHE